MPDNNEVRLAKKLKKRNDAARAMEAVRRDQAAARAALARVDIPLAQVVPAPVHDEIGGILERGFQFQLHPMGWGNPVPPVNAVPPPARVVDPGGWAAPAEINPIAMGAHVGQGNVQPPVEAPVDHLRRPMNWVEVNMDRLRMDPVAAPPQKYPGVPPEMMPGVSHPEVEDLAARRHCEYVYTTWRGDDAPKPWNYFNGSYWFNDMWHNLPPGALLKDERGRFSRHGEPIFEAPLEEFQPDEDTMPARSLPPFKMPYGTHEEISLRLKNSIIVVKNTPVFVYETNLGMEGLEVLIVDALGKRSRLPYAKVDDLRSPAPGYVDYDQTAVYMFRVPERVFQQGLTRKNCVLQTVGDRHRQFDYAIRGLLPGLKARRIRRWNADREATAKNGVAVRLSDHVAAFSNKKGLHIEYKGRYLGALDKHSVLITDPDDLQPTWIGKDLDEVGLEMKVV